ncbi:SEC-C metal-binding domain-containing protein [Sphingomonas bacterium]|uniref:SEC-C metal-binding domain-containing protein n=1 Tax=Sphingomonas bacterium TaxID=1895847 RepID=UPI00345BBB63
MDVRSDPRLHFYQRGLSELARPCTGGLLTASNRNQRLSNGRLSCRALTISPTCPAFEVSSKRRKGYPSETNVKRGIRFVHGDKELVEKLGRNDPCPCGSTRRFQAVLSTKR